MNGKEFKVLPHVRKNVQLDVAHIIRLIIQYLINNFYLISIYGTIQGMEVSYMTTNLVNKHMYFAFMESTSSLLESCGIITKTSLKFPDNHI